MHKRMVLILPAVILLVCILVTASVAQTSIIAEAGVKGSGAIKTSDYSIGQFDINVARSGSALMGGFKFAESYSNATRGHIIYSQKITSLTIKGNFATIEAVGYWNSMPANIKVEALDDLNMDWFRITAVPQGPLTIIYGKEGGLIKGDIVVYAQTPNPDGYTKGDGTIAIPERNNKGRFRFYAEKSGNLIKGDVYFYEYNPMIASIIDRPIVKVYLPAVQRLEFSGKTATLSGKGYLNGKPAIIEVRVVDNRLPTDSNTAAKDTFYITATSLSATSVARICYEAGGPLDTGDVVVKTAY